MLKHGFKVLVVLGTLVMLSPGIHAQPASGENEYRLAAVNPRTSGQDTIDADAGRGIWVADNPDLDNDGKPEILITDYQLGGRVYVYEVIGNDQLELIWVSPVLDSLRPGGGSTPRSVTTGDFDNDGKQEIIFPIGFSATDSLSRINRGLYFYEWTGNDNDFGTQPAYKLTYEAIDSGFADVNMGRTENGIRVQDIDGDGKNELLFPPRQAPVLLSKLYILEIESGTFEDGNAVLKHEYVYEGMVQPPVIAPDSFTPCGTEIGDVDGDGYDEIIVAGWTSISSGAGLGFIQINGPDSYTDGSVIKIADFSAFIVKGKPIFTQINGKPVIYLHGTNVANFESQMWVVEGIVADQFVTDANVYPLFSNVGYWSAWDLGDQDHPTDDPGDGIDLYLYGGGGRLLDIEYDGTGPVTDVNSYTVSTIYDLGQVYDVLGGLFNDVFTYPGMDLDRDGLRDLVAAYKGYGGDTLAGESLAKDGFHVFFFEWGDSTQSINLVDVLTGFEVKQAHIITPEDYELAQNYPNPFNPSTTIEFTLPVRKTIRLTIYNSLGQEARTLINHTPYPAGTHKAVWDGKDNHGNPVPSGMYIYKLVFGNFSKSRKMTLLR